MFCNSELLKDQKILKQVEDALGVYIIRFSRHLNIFSRIQVLMTEETKILHSTSSNHHG